MLQIKVHGATPKTGKSLCTTCKYAQIVRGQNCQEVVVCPQVFGNTKYRGIVPFRVAECGQYHPSTMPWLHEMEDMAWIVEARRRGPAGFGQPEEGEMEVVVRKPKEDRYSTPPSNSPS